MSEEKNKNASEEKNKDMSDVANKMKTGNESERKEAAKEMGHKGGSTTKENSQENKKS